jgi:glutamine amidotransferase-like uncharacterized protein
MPEKRCCRWKIVAIVLIAAMPLFAFGRAASDARIRVGVFDGHGGAQTCIWETLEALRIDPEMDVMTVTSAQIAAGALEGLDVLVIPGGSGSRQYLNLGAQNHERIRRFVAAGRGAVGICAGAYLFSNTPGYACLALNGNRAIDIEHDNRGHGVVRFTLTPEGKALFPELAGRVMNYMAYYEGPVLVDAADELPYSVMALMKSDVHEEGGAPAGMTNDKPFFVANEYGKGRVFSTIAHPEATPGMRWTLPRMARWTARREPLPYPDRFVRPALFEREILFTAEMLKKEAALFQTLLHGKPEEKVAALDWLESHLSWDAKRWVQGLLHDASPLVRERARRYVENCELTMYEPDIAAQGSWAEKVANDH